MGINEDTTTRQTGALRGSIENQGTLPLNKLKQKLVELCFEISKSKVRRYLWKLVSLLWSIHQYKSAFH